MNECPKHIYVRCDWRPGMLPHILPYIETKVDPVCKCGHPRSMHLGVRMVCGELSCRCPGFLVDQLSLYLLEHEADR